MVRLISQTFRSIKPPPPAAAATSSCCPKYDARPSTEQKQQQQSSWCVYLILSTNLPIKTYVGVTTDFSRRLKQHNGEVKGGAKASRAGRPWVCACLIQGFMDKSKACEFEARWKICSRKLPRKEKLSRKDQQLEDNSLRLLQHRQTALDSVKGLIDCSNLDIVWQQDPS